MAYFGTKYPPMKPNPLTGITEREQETMLALLRMPRQQQKDAPKPMSGQGIAQRRRREKERQRATGASGGD
jgi:hypothetical protein